MQRLKQVMCYVLNMRHAWPPRYTIINANVHSEIASVKSATRNEMSARATQPRSDMLW